MVLPDTSVNCVHSQKTFLRQPVLDSSILIQKAREDTLGVTIEH